MKNDYISRYAKHDTNFHRTDPFKLAAWDEEEGVSTKIIATIGFILTITVLLFLG